MQSRRDEVVNAFDVFPAATDAEKFGGQENPPLAFGKIAPDSDAHHTVFVLQCHEGGTARGLGSLTRSDEARCTCVRTMQQCAKLA